MFCKKGILKNFVKFTGKFRFFTEHLWWLLLDLIGRYITRIIWAKYLIVQIDLKSMLFKFWWQVTLTRWSQELFFTAKLNSSRDNSLSHGLKSIWKWFFCSDFDMLTTFYGYLQGPQICRIGMTRRSSPLGKITSRGCLEDVPEKCPGVLRTSPYCPICNAKGRILSGTFLGHTQDVNLTIVHKIDFYGFFSIFPDSNCISDNVLPK